MTEDDARSWLNARWDADAVARLQTFGELVTAENAAQNLVAPSTITNIWTRHLMDSAQLIPLAGEMPRRWLDVGTGAGFPGVVVAILCSSTAVHLVEPRRRRVDFLTTAVRTLGLPNVTIAHQKVEALRTSAFDVISARAVARSDELLRLTSYLRHSATRYILPRGRSGWEEVESLRGQWQGLFHVEQSLTDPESTIIVADGVA